MGALDTTLAALCGFAFVAGFIDAVVGGGGLVQVPALFVLQPQLAPATLFGTNKFSSVFGTANAAWQYARRVQLPWRVLGLTAATAFAFSVLGARAVSVFDPALLRPLVLMPVLLPSGAVPHDLRQLLLFRKLLRCEPQLS